MNPKQTKHALEFFNLVPQTLQAVIAGGAAVDIDKAGDVDIWLLATEDTMALRRKLCAYLNQAIPPEEFQFDSFEERPVPDPDTERYTADGRVIFEGSYKGKNFQILTTTYPRVMDLLGHFDLSIHKVALLRDGTFFTHTDATNPGEMIRIHNFHSPVRTFARARKLIKRYGGAVAVYDLAALVRCPDQEYESFADQGAL